MQPRSSPCRRRVTKRPRGSPKASARSDGSRGGAPPEKCAARARRARSRSSRRGPDRQGGEEASDRFRERLEPAFEEVVRSRDDQDLARISDELREQGGRSEGVALPGHEERRPAGPRQAPDRQRGKRKADGDQRRDPRVGRGRPERHRRAEGKAGRQDRQAAAPDGLV